MGDFFLKIYKENQISILSIMMQWEVITKQNLGFTALEILINIDEHLTTSDWFFFEHQTKTK